MRITPAARRSTISSRGLRSATASISAINATIQQAERNARQSRTSNPKLSRRLQLATEKLKAEYRQAQAQLTIEGERIAKTAEALQRKTLEDARREGKREEQPTYFYGPRGGKGKNRVRLRSRIFNDVTSSGPGGLPLTINIGVLSLLNQAKDRQGRPVWIYVEYPWTRPAGKPGQRGFFFGPGKAAPGAATGQAVFAPSKSGGVLRVSKLFGGYHFLRAGEVLADAEMEKAYNRFALRLAPHLQEVVAAQRALNVGIDTARRRATKR